MSQQPQSHVLFYSNRCQHSQQFVQQLKQAGMADRVTQVCIDHTPRHRIPGTVKSVPTLVIAGSLTPLVGDQAFLWLQEEARQEQERRKQQAQQYAAMGGGTGGQGQPGPGGGGGPEAWHGAEMGGGSYSDAYSFIGADTSAQGSGSSIPKSFAFLGDGGGPSPQAPAVDVKQPFPQMQSTTPDYGQRQRGGQPQQYGQQPPTTAGLPSGYGSMPPNASMAPPTSTPGGDELSQRMEQMRMARDQDVPNPMQRMA